MPRIVGRGNPESLVLREQCKMLWCQGQIMRMRREALDIVFHLLSGLDVRSRHVKRVPMVRGDDTVLRTIEAVGQAPIGSAIGDSPVWRSTFGASGVGVTGVWIPGIGMT